MTPAIELRELRKDYGGVPAVQGVSFHVEPGEIFGFMGHNGAGKTTTLRMLMGLTRPSGGVARVQGLDPATDPLGVRRVTGYLPASYALPPELTARQFLTYGGALCGMGRGEAAARADALIAAHGLGTYADRKMGGLSTGMAQQVGFASALVNRPAVLLLDEPTSGLDPLGRHGLLERLRALAAEGTTVLFSSHILSDVEALCQRVAVLHQGRLVAVGEAGALKRAHGADSMDGLYLALARAAAPKAAA